MSRPKATVEPGQCGDLWPQVAGILCTRPKGHKGGHVHEPSGQYWPAEETIAAMARIGSNCTSCGLKRVNCRCAS